jgi:adenylosuccinate lyase
MIPRYSPKDVAAVWTDEHKYELWLKVELSMMRALERDGQVPNGAANLVEAKVKVDPAAVDELEREIRHDVLAFVTHLERQCGPEGKWIHYGLTSSDVTCTATAMQLAESWGLIQPRMLALCDALTLQAVKHHDTLMIGRTHGVHAEPTTFGHVLANHVEELARRTSRVVGAFGQAVTGKASGAVGVRPFFSQEVEDEHLGHLGLRTERFASQVVTRDRHAELISALALFATSVERLAVNVRHLHRTEVGEAMEAFAGSQRGSSAMPHKQNPILCENICGLARLLRSYVHPAMDDMVLWHERDISHSSVERVILPDAMCLTAQLLDSATSVVEGLRVSPERMLKNIDSNGASCLSGHVLLFLIRKGLTREKAYLAVKRAASVSRSITIPPPGFIQNAPKSLGLPFLQGLLGEPDVMAVTNEMELAEVISYRPSVKSASESVLRAYGAPKQ